MPCEGGAACRVGCDVGALVCLEGGGAMCDVAGGLAPEGTRCSPDELCVEGTPCTFVGSCDVDGFCVPDPDPGVLVEPERSFITSENGMTDGFSVRLQAAPTAGVSVSMTVDLPAEASLEPAALVFGPDDWDLPQDVVLQGLDDGVDDPDQPFVVQFAVTSTDAQYEGLEVAPLDGVNLALTDCVYPEASCDGDPTVCETTLTTNDSCGSCSESCLGPVPNGDEDCVVAGVPSCALRCDTGFATCDGDPDNGCEVDTNTDVAHCGRCARVCPDRPNSSPLCSAGTCAFACDAGFLDCDGLAANGCEIDTRSDPLHCGGCGDACPDLPNSTPTCAASSCGFACDPGFGDCEGAALPGCGTDLSIDFDHCGACDNACPTSAPNAGFACEVGACAIQCDAGFSDCNGAPGDGCEADLTTVEHCGACGAMCVDAPNAAPICKLPDTCAFECDPDFRNCDGVFATGCEAHEYATTTCGESCEDCTATVPANATATCNGESCGYMCIPGSGDCDGMTGNGCEADLSGDPRNCGVCGNVCVGECTDGSCTAGCAAVGEDCSTLRCCDGASCPADNRCPAACAAPTDPCGDGVLCCDGQACAGGRCPASCGSTGQACEMGRDCCSSVCKGGFCDAGGACSGFGEACGDGGTCCEFLFCGSRSNLCERCVGAGASCMAPEECCTGTCSLGRCTGG
jgi:hypothetical protein